MAETFLALVCYAIGLMVMPSGPWYRRIGAAILILLGTTLLN